MHGIKGHPLEWITYYLIGRKQRDVLDGCKSSLTVVKSDVPQGLL